MLNGLVVNGLAIGSFDEAAEAGAGKYRIVHQENRIPMVYSIVASKKIITLIIKKYLTQIADKAMLLPIIF